MRLGILGSVLVVDDSGTEIPISAGRQRTLLAALLVHANRIVPLSELADILWDGTPPLGSDGTVRSYVMRLRQTVGANVAERIVTRGPGYLCQVAEDELDVLRFEALCRDGSAATRHGSWSQAQALLSEALDLWRGEPLEDVASQLLRLEYVQRLEQLRIQAAEWRIEAELNLGEHAQLVPQLQGLVRTHPLRENLYSQLMLALYRSGRAAEALQTYQQARRYLVDELGVDPGPQLQRLHEQILRGDPALVTPLRDAHEAHPAAGNASTVTPRQLPATVRHFSGRADELRTLASLLRADDAPAVATIDGTAGIGKTALAVRYGHQFAERFPDGQLYVNLRGFDAGGPPLDAEAALRHFLESLGTPAARVPAGLDAQLGMYRSLLANRRMLIVVDNARESGQVRPLLPGVTGCLVLVTSRNRLTDLVALDGAVPITVGLLSRDEAHDLLTRRLGVERVAREEEAAGELIEFCARLPLALNIVAARAACEPNTPLGAFTSQLHDTKHRLDLLSAGEDAANVRMVFSWSYQSLDRPAARMFRLLGLHPGPDVGVNAAASIAGVSGDEARRLLGDLTAAHMLTQHSPGRYGFHDLLRDYARELADADDPAEQHAATLRMFDYYLHTAFAADEVLEPSRDRIAIAPIHSGVVVEDVADLTQILDWFRNERLSALAVIAHAARTGYDTHAWQIPWSFANYIQRQGLWHDQIEIHEAALAAATRLDDRAAQAYAHRVLGRAHTPLAAFQIADTHLRRALELHEELGDLLGQAAAHRGIVWVYERQGDADEAIVHAHQAVDLYRAAGHRAGEATALNAVAWLQIRREEYEQAIATCWQGLDLYQQEGVYDRAAEANTRESLGFAYHHVGRYADAIEWYQRALPFFREQGDRYFEADTLSHLGDTYLATGDRQAADEVWRQAIAIFDDLGHPNADRVREKIEAS